MRLTIVDRYLLREIGQTWIAVTAILLFILMGNALAAVFRRAAQGRLPVDAVLPFFFTKTASYLVMLIPLGLYLGIMLGLGRLYKDSEMSALAACGIGPRDIYRPVLFCAVLGVVTSAVFTGWISPWAAGIEQELRQQFAARSELSAIMPGQFNELENGDAVVFTRALSQDGSKLKDVFIYERDFDGRPAIEVASSAERTFSGVAEQNISIQNNERFLVLNNGTRYVGKPGDADYEIIRFKRHGVFVPRQPRQEAKVKLAAKPTMELVSSEDIQEKAELQARISIPLGTLLLAMMAVPLSHTTPRKGRYGRLVVAVLVYIPYSNLVIISKNWFQEGIVPPALGMWWVHVIGLAVTIALLIRMNGFGWIRHLITRRFP